MFSIPVVRPALYRRAVDRTGARGIENIARGESGRVALQILFEVCSGGDDLESRTWLVDIDHRLVAREGIERFGIVARDVVQIVRRIVHERENFKTLRVEHYARYRFCAARSIDLAHCLFRRKLDFGVYRKHYTRAVGCGRIYDCRVFRLNAHDVGAVQNLPVCASKQGIIVLFKPRNSRPVDGSKAEHLA